MTNIATVVLDTLRYDNYNTHFDWISGKKFTEAYSTSHWTIPAHVSLYTGYYPSEIGIHGKSMTLDFDDEVLPELFESEGYTTRLLTANPQIHMWDGWKRGYEISVGPTNLDPSDDKLVDWNEFYSKQYDSTIKKYIQAVLYCIESDSPTIKSMIKGVKNNNQPANNGIESIIDRVRNIEFGHKEFLFLNIMDTHTPYNPPKEYTDVQTPVDIVAGDAFAGSVENPEEIRQVYDDSVRYLSDRYRELYNELRSDFDYIITLSDHGEMLGEHGMWNHSYGLYPELVHIPLVISGDDIKDGTDDTVVSILDVHKTICELAGIDAESRGQNLLGEFEPESRLFEYHGFLHWHQDQFERKGVDEEVYEKRDRALDGFVSPSSDYVYQTHDDGLRISGSVTPMEANDQLAKLIGSIDRKNIESKQEPSGVSDEVREQLEDLGYA
ncbi:sulfatase-like hydrolase/transferase [Natrinema gelatinilyticum]|uniref:sulfatase-like hydrolase/transferase n=1 Tax=Natrinema gelatinilyticum TaxID=2961571 RepID=UPI0020C45396|nr:sulfatase-like hydrolase/transferase [Natrinema gelatinilyticum]